MKVCLVKTFAFTLLVSCTLIPYSSAQESRIRVDKNKIIIFKPLKSNPGLSTYSISGESDNNIPYLGLHIVDSEGVFVTKVIDQSPAQISGLQRGDLIMSIDNRKLSKLAGLISILNDYVPKDKVEVQFYRNNQIHQTIVTLGGKEVYETSPIEEVTIYDERSLEERGKLGISLFESEKLVGILIADVFDQSPADKAGLKEEDIITSVNGKQVISKNDLKSALMDLGPGDSVSLQIMRAGEEITIKVTLD